MKKVIALLFLTSLASAFTAQQIQTIYVASGQINGDSAKIIGLYNLFAAGGTYQIQGSTVTYTLTAAQGQDLTNEYNALKADMCTTQCSQMP
jgi:hypothetical protein